MRLRKADSIAIENTMRGPELLTRWREEIAKITQTEAAALIPVSQATWSDWEKGKKVPKVGPAVKLEKVSDGAVPVEAWVKADDAEPHKPTGTEGR